MSTLRAATLAAALLLTGGTAASADSYFEVESARANARAGGPVSERDAELLNRYGCLSGTRSAFCERQRANNYYYQAPRKHRHRRAH